MKKVKDTVIYHSNKLNKKKHIITQVDAKIIWQNPISIMIFLKSHRKLEIERNILNINMDNDGKPIVQFSSVQLLSHARLFATLWTAACQASLSITNSQSLPKLMSIESVMPSNHLILCRPLLLPSIFPSIRVFSNESAFRIRWPKYCSFSFNISPSNEHPGLIS